VATVSTPAVSQQLTHYMLPEAVFLTTAIAAEPLPVRGGLNAPLLSDKNNPGLRCYLPGISLVRPAANEAPDSSPFLFDLERIGTSASAPAPRASRPSAPACASRCRCRCRCRCLQPPAPRWPPAPA
jgi:hypothetical protein